MRKIKLTQGKYALVDDEDFELISKFKWHLAKRTHLNYGIRNIIKNGKRTSISIHTMLLNPPVGFVCDHINGNGLDNTRKNLRICSIKENAINRRGNKNSTSVYKGVCKINMKVIDKKNGRNKVYFYERYLCQFICNGKKKAIVFKTEIEAAKEYDKLSVLYNKDFAKTNFQK